MELGLLERAVPPQKTALEIRRKILLDEHPVTLDSINSMGALSLWLLRKGGCSHAENCE